jgi:hypothetical protein
MMKNSFLWIGWTFSAGIAMEAAENEINEKCLQFLIVDVKVN